MVSPEELLKFRAALDDRRQRLLSLVEVVPAQVDWVSELETLGEELAIAGEKLRVQDEELSASREAVSSFSRAYADLLTSSAEALVLTDQDGTVIQSSQGADTLLGRDPSRPARPITTWFATGDRSTARAALTMLKRGPERVVELSDITVRRADGSEHTVDATISVVVRMSCTRQLLWTLQKAPERGHLRLVRNPCGSDEPDPADGAARLTEVASRLARADGAGQVGNDIVQLAAAYLPQADSVWLLHRSRPVAATGAADHAEVRELVSLQLRLGEGPLAAVATDGPLISGDLSHDQRWPRLRALMPPRVTAALAVALPSASAVLFAVADQAGAFDRVDRPTLQQFAVLAGMALHRAVTVDQLEKAIATRQTIGGAVGILMERHRITPAQAFDRLVHASQHANVKLRDIATRLVETGEEPALTPDSPKR